MRRRCHAQHAMPATEHAAHDVQFVLRAARGAAAAAATLPP